MKAAAVEANSGAELDRVYRDVRVRLRNYLARYVDPVEAEDLVQDVFVKALRSAGQGRAPSNLTAWLFTVARTTAIDRLRAQGPPTDDIALLEERLADEPESIERKQLAECLEPLLGQLPALYGETLRRVDLQRKPMRELADREAVSLSAIKSRASRGRHMLGELLRECCVANLDADANAQCRSGEHCC